MRVKVFKVGINDNGSMRFIDPRDKEAFIRTLLFLKKNKGVETIEIAIETIDEESTEKQQALFKVLCSKISSNSQYSYKMVEDAFLSYFGYTFPSDIPKDNFTNVLEHCVALANEIFDIKVKVNYENNHIEIE